MNNTIANLIHCADKCDHECLHNESDKIDKLMTKIAQYQDGYSYNESNTNMSPYYQRMQENQQMYQPNMRAFNESSYQPSPPVQSYGTHMQSRISHAPYMQYFLNSAEKLLVNTINAGYSPQEAYQYALQTLTQSMQNKRVPQKITLRILSAFNDWVRFTNSQITQTEFPKESYYAQQYPQRSYAVPRRRSISPRGQYGRTRFFG